jgi:Mg-chelatase subunit ChlD
MFLRPSPPRVTKRSRLENFWLLLARCLVIGLLALAFARPFLPKATPAPPPGSGQRTVILVDTSASMRRDKLWPDAQSRVDARLRAIRPGDEIALLTFDKGTQTVIGFEEWRKLPMGERVPTANQRLSAIKPGWSSTSLDDALLHAVEVLDQAGETAPSRREIVVISDVQEARDLTACKVSSGRPGSRSRSTP